MPIRVKFFASLKDATGTNDAALDFQPGMTVDAVWQQTTQGLARNDNVLCAVNMEYVNADQVVADGDEVAFFPPVTGGAA